MTGHTFPSLTGGIHTMFLGLKQLCLWAVAEAGASEGGRTFFESLQHRWEGGKEGMYPIALCAIVALAIGIERTMVLFASASINKDGFLRGLKKHIYAGDLDKALNYVAGQK